MKIRHCISSMLITMGVIATMAFSGCQPTTSTTSHNYENKKYGFPLVVPQSVSAFETKVDADTIPPWATATILFSLKDSHRTPLFEVAIFTPDGWKQHRKAVAVGENNNYYFDVWGASIAGDTSKSFSLSEEELNQIKESFRTFNPQ